MSKDLGTLEDTGSRGVDMGVTRFYGGAKNGTCVQLTAVMEGGENGYVQLNASDIVALMPVFKNILDCALSEKKRDAEAAIAENEALRKTIVKDMAEVASMAIAQPVLDCASLMNFGKKQLTGGDDDEH